MPMSHRQLIRRVKRALDFQPKAQAEFRRRLASSRPARQPKAPPLSGRNGTHHPQA